MKVIHFRVDDWLKERLEAFDLSVYECVRRVVRQVKKGKLIIKPSKFGKLEHIIKVELPDDMADVQPSVIRDALLLVFSEMSERQLKIDNDDLKYKKNIDELMNNCAEA